MRMNVVTENGIERKIISFGTSLATTAEEAFAARTGRCGGARRVVVKARAVVLAVLLTEAGVCHVMIEIKAVSVMIEIAQTHVRVVVEAIQRCVQQTGLMVILDASQSIVGQNSVIE